MLLWINVGGIFLQTSLLFSWWDRPTNIHPLKNEVRTSTVSGRLSTRANHFDTQWVMTHCKSHRTSGWEHTRGHQNPLKDFGYAVDSTSAALPQMQTSHYTNQMIPQYKPYLWPVNFLKGCEQVKVPDPNMSVYRQTIVNGQAFCDHLFFKPLASSHAIEHSRLFPDTFQCGFQNTTWVKCLHVFHKNNM